MKKAFLCLVLFACSLFANSLSDIRSSGVIRIGVPTDQPPFGSYKDGKFEGFEIDFANRIAKDFFGSNGGRVEFVPTKASERIDFLQDNKVDMVIATLTVTDERSKMVDFSMPYFAVNIGVLTRKDDNIRNISDLKKGGEDYPSREWNYCRYFFQERGLYSYKLCKSKQLL